MISKNEYFYIKERNKLSEVIYEFGQKIEATVVENSFNIFLLFTTKEMIERETDNFQNVSILSHIDKNSLHKISMGIGYGNTASESRYNSNNAMIKAIEYEENTAFVIYEDEYIIGPIHSNKEYEESKIENKIINISQKTDISVNKVLEIYNTLDKYKLKTFTTSELSRYCKMPQRTINRVLSKLEEFDYIEVVGKEFPKGSGRPKRVMKIKF